MDIEGVDPVLLSDTGTPKDRDEGNNKREFVYYESMKRKLIQNLYMNVGVMKDYKLRDLHTSHTLGWSWYWNT